MSLSVLASISGIPGLEPAIGLVGKTYETAQNVKIYREQCQDLSSRCIQLLEVVANSPPGAGGQRTQEAIDDVEAVIERVNRRVLEWSQLSTMKSLVKQGEIKRGIEASWHDIEGAMRKFNFTSSVEISRAQKDMQALQAMYQDELKTKLDAFMDQQRTTLTDATPIMQVIQEELQESDQHHIREPHLQRGLYALHKATSLLPPLPDLNGQVERTSANPVAHGGYNDVYTGQWLGEEKVALKVSRAVNDSRSATKKFEREVEIWRGLNHPHVARLYGLVKLDDVLYSVSQWMDNGSAIDYVKRNPQADRMRILSEVASGLAYLHTKKVVHGDLRGVNVLISLSGKAVVSDFGLSKVLEEEISTSSTTGSSGLSVRWSAPEILNPEIRASVSFSSDVWSYGMLCYELLTGSPPYPMYRHDIQVAMVIVAGKLPERPGEPAISRGLSESLWAILVACWQHSPGDRPSMGSVKEELRQLYGDSPLPPPRTPTTPAMIPDAPQPATSPRTFSPQEEHAPPEHRQINPLQPTSGPGRLNIAFQTAPPMSGSFEIARTSPSTATPSTSRSTSIPGLSPVSPYSSSSYRQTSSRRSSIPDTFVEGSSGGRQRSTTQSSSRPSTGDSGKRISPVPEKPRPSFDSRRSSRGGSASAPILILRNGHGRDQSTTLDVMPELVGSAPSSFGLSSSPGSGLLPLRPADSSQSTFSQDSSGSSRLDAAVCDQEPVTRLSARGEVEAGTLHGLLHHLLTAADATYKEVFTISYRAFTTADVMLEHFIQQYDSVEDDTVPTQWRVDRRYSILSLMREWIETCYLEKNPEFLERVKSFAARVSGSSVLQGLAHALTAVAVQKLVFLQRPDVLSPKGGAKLVAHEPVQLATALTILEGELYKRILPSECVAYLKRLFDRRELNPSQWSAFHEQHWNHVDTFRRTNNKLAFWVKSSVMRHDSVDRRVNVFRYFVFAAEECYKMRNFSSMSAIVTALQSPVLTRLVVTRKELKKTDLSLLKKLGDVLSADNHFGAYLGALESSTKPCVPWLDVHLRLCHAAFRLSPTVDHSDGRPLINFARCGRLTARVRDALRYKPPDIAHARDPEAGWVAYVESALRKVQDDAQAREKLESRSRELQDSERRMYDSRQRELEAVGFPTS